LKPSLEKSYAADQATWKNSNHAAYVNNLKSKAELQLNRNALVSYNPIELEVYSAKGKDFDYSEIEEAYDLAYDAYEDIEKNGISSGNFEKLTKAIAIWESELESADLEDKDARINKKVAQGLYINLTYAHFTMFSMDDAAVFAQKADQSFGNFTNNVRTEIQQLRKDVNRRKAGINKNTELIKDPSKLNILAEQSSSTKFVLVNYEGTMEDADSDYFNFTGNEMTTIAEAAEEANIDGGGTSYDKYIMPNSVPMTLSIMRLQETLTEFPVGITEIEGLGSVVINSNDIETIPAEIGNMSSLKKLWLVNNKISEIPDEIGSLSSLKSLNLSNNPISKFQESIKHCSDLKKLNLKGTNVSLDNLKELESWVPNCKIKM
jgi:Leucine-rich repeat (LRR) protein